MTREGPHVHVSKDHYKFTNMALIWPKEVGYPESDHIWGHNREGQDNMYCPEGLLQFYKLSGGKHMGQSTRSQFQTYTVGIAHCMPQKWQKRIWDRHGRCILFSSTSTSWHVDNPERPTFERSVWTKRKVIEVRITGCNLKQQKDPNDSGLTVQWENLLNGGGVKRPSLSNQLYC